MGYLIALVAIFFWSLNFIIASYFSGSISPVEISFGRWFIASSILLAFTWKDIRHHQQLLKDNWWLIFFLALTGVVVDNTLIYYAGHTASPINMGLIGVMGPVFLVILSRIFLKIPIVPQQAIGMIVAVFGVITIIVKGDFAALSKIKFVIGDFFMLINTFGFAIYSILQTKRPKEISQVTFLTMTAAVGTIILFPSLLLVVGAQQSLMIDMKDVEMLIYLGIFNSIIAFLAWNTALAQIGNIKTSIIYYIMPIFIGIEAHLFLGEQLEKSQIWGGILVIFGVMLVSLHKRMKPEKK